MFVRLYTVKKHIVTVSNKLLNADDDDDDADDEVVRKTRLIEDASEGKGKGTYT